MRIFYPTIRQCAIFGVPPRATFCSLNTLSRSQQGPHNVIQSSPVDQPAARRYDHFSADANRPLLHVAATTPLATQLLAHYFAASMLPGDCYLLHGEVGAGKSYFSRAFVRAALRDEEAAVPSPTFLLQNIYPTDPPVHHLDLYRLDKAEQLSRLDLEATIPTVVSLIEWPERLDALSVPRRHLDVRIAALSKAESAVLERKLYPIGERYGDGREDGVLKDFDDDDTDDDARWRSVKLLPRGQRWAERVEALRLHVKARGAEFGLLLLSTDADDFTV